VTDQWRLEIIRGEYRLRSSSFVWRSMILRKYLTLLHFALIPRSQIETPVAEPLQTFHQRCGCKSSCYYTCNCGLSHDYSSRRVREVRGRLGPGTVLQEVIVTLAESDSFQKQFQPFVVVAAWLMFAFVISSAYRKILTASLTLPNIPSRPESVQELVPLIDR
ncbi:putative iGluR-like protein, partial [Homarus americanus]